MTTPYKRFPYGMRVEYIGAVPRSHAKRGTVVTKRRRDDSCERVRWDDVVVIETIHRKFISGLWERQS